MSWSVEKTILVPFDFSEPSHAAIDKAIEIASNPSQIHVLHVLPPFIPLAPEGIPIEWSDDRLRVEQAQQHLQKELHDRKYEGVACEVRIGDPGTECADRAESLDADLIILPSHGKSGLTRLLLGSVTERIVRLSKRPVLVLKI